MSKLQVPKKLRIEDFKSDQQELIGKLGYAINSFMDDTYNCLNNKIDYSNLNRQLVTLTLQVDANSKLINPPSIKTTTSGSVVGILVLSASNQTNSNTYPTSAPFVSWTISNGIVQLLNITGLQASSKYQLLLEIIGN